MVVEEIREEDGYDCPWCRVALKEILYRKGTYLLACSLCRAVWERSSNVEEWELIQLGGSRLRLLMGEG